MSYFRQEDLFWWHNNVKLQTGVMDLYITGEKDAIEHFISPNTLQFQKRNDGPKGKIFTVVNQLPLDFDLWTPEVLEKCITVIKFIIEPDEMLYIDFVDLGTTVLKAMIKTDYRPTYEELQSAQTIDANHSSIQHFLDVWLPRSSNLYLGFIIQQGIVEQHIIMNNMTQTAARNKRQVVVKPEYRDKMYSTDVHLKFKNMRCMSFLRSARRWSNGDCKVRKRLKLKII